MITIMQRIHKYNLLLKINSSLQKLYFSTKMFFQLSILVMYLSESIIAGGPD